MFYAASKILFFLVKPSSLCVLLLGAGLWLSGRPRFAVRGRRLALTGFALLVVFGLSPLGMAAIYPLEQRFAGERPPADAGGFTGIIILGGFEDGRISNGRATLALNEAGERLTEGVRLAHRLPQARVVFTGGVAGVLLHQESAGRAVAAYLRDVGLQESRIVLEERSRTTWENAVFTRELVKPQPGERFLLVTSAWHMPRAIGAFRKAGWNVAAWPADYRTRDAGDLARPFDGVSEGWERLDVAVKEWIGLLTYYAMGRSDSLWPSPR